MFKSKTKYFVIAVGLSSIMLAGCPRIDDAPKSRVAEAPKNEERPDWVYEEPDEDDGKLFFVGLSEVNVSERKARKGALKDATESVIKYLGTMAKSKFERVSQSYGLSSETVNATTAAQDFEKQLSANLTRRIKGKKWHHERELDSKGVLGWKYFVLAEIPTSEIEQSFKNTLDKSIEKQQEEAEKAATDKAKKQSELAIDMFRKMKKEGLIN